MKVHHRQMEGVEKTFGTSDGNGRRFVSGKKNFESMAHYLAEISMLELPSSSFSLVVHEDH